MDKITRCQCCTTTLEDSSYGICSTCESLGVWIDPCGGIHLPTESDPASHYE